jgi:hypothetical protein
VAAEAPRWDVITTTNPTTFVTGSTPEPQIVITAVNVGGAATDGSPITIGDALPAGFEAIGITGYSAYKAGSAGNGEAEGEAAMACEALPSLSCTYSGAADPGDALVVTIHLAPIVDAPTVVSTTATVSGGGAPEASGRGPIVVATSPSTFGPTQGTVRAALSSDQAGAHPDVTTSFNLNTSLSNELSGYPRDVDFTLPPGLVGTAAGLPRCPISHVIELLRNPDGCPADTMVGMAIVTLSEGNAHGFNQTIVAPIYNIAPAQGEPAAFAFNAFFFPVLLDTSVLTNGDYNVKVSTEGIAESAQTLSAQVTFWGVPADHSGPGEDKSLYNLFGGGSFGGPDPAQTRTALLTSPQQCSEPLSAVMSVDSWEQPGSFLASEPAAMGTLEGCERLSFEPSYSFVPETPQAGAQSGYRLDLRNPQNQDPDGLAPPTVKGLQLTLPPGVVVNPAGAEGLTACSNGQFAIGASTPASCPASSQIGNVEVITPAFTEPLHGSLFLGEPECDPCAPADAGGGKMVRLFLQVSSEGESAVIIKLEGRGRIDQASGRVEVVFEHNPQLPFSELRSTVKGGPRAVLANPRTCGAVASALDLTPWSTPFTADSNTSSTFSIGEGCFGPQLTPSFAAGVGDPSGGQHSAFTMSLGRSDPDEMLGSVELHLPPGLLGEISTVTPCASSAAEAGSCGPESLIGHAQALLGAGPAPLDVGGGQVFLAGPYEGQPFSLSIVVPATAGPYTLAGTNGHGSVVVRATIAIDPATAAVTVRTDPLPTSLDGIPLQIRAVNVTIDRSGFMLNPTDCALQSIAGVVSSPEGLAVPVATRFTATNCALLTFKPKFTASTSSHTSKADGASLKVRVAYPSGSLGTQANIKSVKVALPKSLPSRLTTLQKACTAKAFETNPASCPPESIIGRAVVRTQLLPVPLEGPAYFVSHGGEAFPNLIMVLQGDGVTVQLVGDTLIKNGITSTTFASTPDVPFESFELTLPQGKDSALAANGNLCQQQLVVPTAFTAQNGTTLNQNTHIEVESCSNTLSLISKHLTKNILKLSVAVPSSGKLTADGVGLSKATKSAKGRETITVMLKVKPTKAQAALLAHHHGRKLVDHVKLTFGLANGRKLTKTFSVVV